MVKRENLLALSFYEKYPFTGSDNGLRYRIEKKEYDNEKKLCATAWRSPLAFDYTPGEDKTTFLADFSDDGLVAVAEWLNTQ